VASPTQKMALTPAEVRIYESGFSGFVDASGTVSADEVSQVLERLLHRPVSALERKVFVDAVGGADRVSFGAFMEKGMGLAHPDGIAWSVNAAKESASAPAAAAPAPAAAAPAPVSEAEASASVKQLESEKAEDWAAAAAKLSEEQKARIRSLHTAFDQLGDGNGTVEKNELEAVDKKGKFFQKLDASSSGHVTVDAFVAYFGDMVAERGEKGAEGLLQHLEKYVGKQQKAAAREEAVKEVVDEKAAVWATALAALTEEQKAKVAALHTAFDKLGDGNGTVEKEELEAVDKRGKMFDKLDSSSSGHVTVEAFQAFFGNMKTDRGETAAVKLMEHLQKYIDQEMEKVSAVKEIENEKSKEWEAQAQQLSNEQRSRVRLLHAAFDDLGDGNGTVDKDELKVVDKTGKLFVKLDATAMGHVTVDSFEAYFGKMKVERGEKAILGLMMHMEKQIELQRESAAAGFLAGFDE